MKEKVTALLTKKTKLPLKEIENILEIPPNLEMGDYAFPTFILSKKLKKPPTEIALELSRELNKKLPKEINKIENKGPYINFFMDKKIVIKEVISKAIESNYGQGKEKQKILLEHTSINPNASPHVGRARNSIIGDSIYRILTFRGNKVERHYYVNDVSKQIAILSLNFKKTDKFEDMLKRYVEVTKKIEANPELEKQVFELLEKFENKDKKTVALFKKIVDICIKGQKEIFNEFDIHFDHFDYESRYVGESSKKLLKKLEKTGKLFTDKENRIVLDQKNTHLIRKMRTPVFVLARSNGTGLYGLRDIAYTIDKSKFGKNIIVLGEDQKLYFEQISEVMKLLNHQPPEVVHYSFVLIQEGKEIKKMSPRRGELVLLEEFFAEAIKKADKEIKKRKTKGNAKKIAIAAIKYAMLRNDNDKNIIFSWDQSLNFEGESGPYLQYSYARASSILRKSKNKSKLKIPDKFSKSEIELAKKIAEFPTIVEKASTKLSPNLIANYSFQLAQIFSEFYHANKVIGDENETFRLKLVEAFQNTIKNSLSLLGIEVMEKM
ncbi:arginine--tRNA ligase [Candidatus Pacearchaeota archaeon]|nr:arginine--tRNA ligase [Candidatus Pacearchaeota archaeon]